MKWERVAPRLYKQSRDEYSAYIFGSPAPVNMWAWGVWSMKDTNEGIEYSLRRAKAQAWRAIARTLGGANETQAS